LNNLITFRVVDQALPTLVHVVNVKDHEVVFHVIADRDNVADAQSRADVTRADSVLPDLVPVIVRGRVLFDLKVGPLRHLRFDAGGRSTRSPPEEPQSQKDRTHQRQDAAHARESTPPFV